MSSTYADRQQSKDADLILHYDSTGEDWRLRTDVCQEQTGRRWEDRPAVADDVQVAGQGEPLDAKRHELTGSNFREDGVTGQDGNSHPGHYR